MNKNEKNQWFHYQVVKHTPISGPEELTVHEAISLESGEIFKLNPIPIYVVGDTHDELDELISSIDKDMKLYPVQDASTLIAAMDRWTEDEEMFLLDEAEAIDFMNEEEELLHDDYCTEDGKVIDLVDYFKGKRK